MQLLKPFGFAEEQLNSVVGTVTFPYYAQSRGVTGKDAFAKSSSGFNPPASESLTLYPIIRLVLMDCLETFPHDNVLMRAGRSLCYMFDLLDLLVQTMKTHHQVPPSRFQMRRGFMCRLSKISIALKPYSQNTTMNFILEFR